MSYQPTDIEVLDRLRDLIKASDSCHYVKTESTNWGWKELPLRTQASPRFPHLAEPWDGVERMVEQRKFNSDFHSYRGAESNDLREINEGGAYNIILSMMKGEPLVASNPPDLRWATQGWMQYRLFAKISARLIYEHEIEKSRLEFRAIIDEASAPAKGLTRSRSRL